MLTSLLVLTVLGVTFAVQVLRDRRTLTAKVERLAAQLENVENLQSPTLRSAVVRAAQPLRKRYQIGLTLNDGILKLLSDEEMKFWNDQAITLPSVTIERWRGHTRVRARFTRRALSSPRTGSVSVARTARKSGSGKPSLAPARGAILCWPRGSLSCWTANGSGSVRKVVVLGSHLLTGDS